MKKLFDHQKAGLEFLRERKCAALFWDMRLGKTKTAIRWMKSLPVERSLIVAPLSVLPVWVDELADEGIACTVLTGNVKQRMEAFDKSENKVFCINYEGLLSRSKNRTEASPMAYIAWDCVILDESTRIKNPQAKTTRVAQKYLASARYRLLLSGMPNPESALDLFEQIRFLNGHFDGCRTYWDFRNRYFTPFGEYDWFPKKGAVSAINSYVRHFSSVLTRKQAGYYTPKVYERRYVYLPDAVMRKYRKVEREYAMGEKETNYTVVRRSWLHRIAGGFPDEAEYIHRAKLDELVSLIDENFLGQPVVVYCRYTNELKAILTALRDAGHLVRSIHGETQASVREALVNGFRKKHFNILVCQTKCVQYGLNFSRASAVVYYSNWEDMEIRAQSEDRTVHLEKDTPCLYIDLIAKDTVDEDIHASLQGKRVSTTALRSRIVESLHRRALK